MKHMDHLHRVIAARKKQDEARQRLVAALADAVAAGIPQTDLAPVVGVSRVTLWRWLAEDKRGRAARTADPATATGRNPDAAAAD